MISCNCTDFAKLALQKRHYVNLFVHICQVVAVLWNTSPLPTVVNLQRVLVKVTDVIQSLLYIIKMMDVIMTELRQ